MVKKEFTDEWLREHDNLSDIELIEIVAKGTLSQNRQASLIAILDGRLKKVINHLKEITERNIESQEKYSTELVNLTGTLVTLTKVLVFLTILLAAATLILLFK